MSVNFVIFKEGNVLKDLIMKALMTLDTQGLVLYFHHSTQSFGDSLYDNTLELKHWVACT